MKVYTLHGHERPLTQLKYSTEGDLLFSTAKDFTPCVFCSETGQLIGKYEGHRGAIYDCDVSWDTRHFMTGAADYCFKLWDAEYGKVLKSVDVESICVAVEFDFVGDNLLVVKDSKMGQTCEIMVFDKRDGSQFEGSEGVKPWQKISFGKANDISCAVWGPDCETVIVGHENGEMGIYNIKTGECEASATDHSHKIMDLQLRHDRTMIVSASKDGSAKVFGAFELDCVKTFLTDKNVNSASISPTADHVLLGGGQEAETVATQRAGIFELRLCHLIYEDEFGRIKGHFAPINTVVFSPTGNGFASGSEDGYIRLHEFDDLYKAFHLD